MDGLNLHAMKLSTIEQTYLLPHARGLFHQQLLWADGRATLNAQEVKTGKQFHQSEIFPVLQKRITEIQSRGYRDDRPVPLLDGNEIMEFLKIQPGPRIGELLNLLRDAQLEGIVKTKDQALKFIRSRHAT
jgi:tRNA nucleotidyltransferase/poly(A) polymerase